MVDKAVSKYERWAKKNWGTQQKSSPFLIKKTAFFVEYLKFFGPSYFETALAFGYRDDATTDILRSFWTSFMHFLFTGLTKGKKVKYIGNWLLPMYFTTIIYDYYQVAVWMCE